MKEFNKFEKVRIKRTAQNVDQYVTKKKKLIDKINEYQNEVDALQKLIDLSDEPVKLMTGGYGTEDLIKKVITPTDKVDKNGRVIKITTYEFIYPDTIIPPVEEVLTTEGKVGSDYDQDTITLNESNI